MLSLTLKIITYSLIVGIIAQTSIESFYDMELMQDIPMMGIRILCGLSASIVAWLFLFKKVEK